MGALRVAKRDLRRKIRTVLSGLSQDEIVKQSECLLHSRSDFAIDTDAASVVVEKLKSSLEYRQAQRVSVFLSMPEGEISTAAIVRDALKGGKQVFVPYTYKTSPKGEGQPISIMDMVELRSIDDYESLKADNWGIPTPDGDTIEGRRNSFGGRGLSHHSTISSPGQESGLDLIVMPGMAFDSDLGRLGHGKGFYDYFLARCAHASQRNLNSMMPYLGECAQFKPI